MKTKRILRTILVILSFALTIAFPTFAHPGKTDSNGGHTDRETGEYHYHHGYPAHDHYDMDGDGDIDCPYDFDDETDHNSKENNDKDHASHPTTSQTSGINSTDSKNPNAEQRDIFSSLGIEEYRWIVSLQYLSFAVISVVLLIAFYSLYRHAEASSNATLRRFTLVLMIAPVCVLLPVIILVGSVIMMATAIMYVIFLMIAIPFPKLGDKIMSAIEFITNRQRRK